VGTEARRRRHRNADRPCARDEPLSTRRSITSDGDQTAPGIRKARAAGSSPATGHARPSRTLRPSCARARRRARHRVACPWARRPTRSHRPLPHSLACSARPGGASAGVGNESLREPHARHLIFRDRSQAGHGAFAEPSPLATDQTDDVRASGEVEVVAVSDRLVIERAPCDSSAATIWLWLHEDATKPWQQRCRRLRAQPGTPRQAGRALDLYRCARTSRSTSSPFIWAVREHRWSRRGNIQRSQGQRLPPVATRQYGRPV
jgi:hypothetical protein